MTATGTPVRLTTGVDRVPPIRLREIDCNLTNYCNLECIHCSYSSTRSKAEPALSTEVVHRLLDDAAALGNQVFHWSGGEPATRSDLAELIAHASTNGFGMRLLSNGILLDQKRLAAYWDAGLRKVLVSMDGLEAHHDHHRASPGLFPKTMRGIRNAVAAGYHTRVNAAATTDNVDDMVPLATLLSDEGVHTFTVFYLISVGRGADIAGLQVPPDRWRSLIAEMTDLAASLPTPMEITVEKVFAWNDEPGGADGVDGADGADGGHGGRGHGCLGFLDGCDYVNVLADGRVYPCVCFVDKAPALGNVNERPLGDILHDPRSWRFYWGLTDTNTTCAGCGELDRCGGGSRAASWTAAGDWFALDPRCTGDPTTQGYIPVCFMLREDVTTRARSGFAEAVPSTPPPVTPGSTP